MAFKTALIVFSIAWGQIMLTDLYLSPKISGINGLLSALNLSQDLFILDFKFHQVPWLQFIHSY